jgi:hypothetical protein
MRDVISAQNTTMPLVEYQGRRVVTFSMVDDVHQRPKDTAKRLFSVTVLASLMVRTFYCRRVRGRMGRGWIFRQGH